MSNPSGVVVLPLMVVVMISSMKGHSQRLSLDHERWTLRGLAGLELQTFPLRLVMPVYTLHRWFSADYLYERIRASVASLGRFQMLKTRCEKFQLC